MNSILKATVGVSESHNNSGENVQHFTGGNQRPCFVYFLCPVKSM